MKVLVTYGSRHGSTQGIAERIAQALTTEGLTVDTEPVDRVTDPTAYDAFVIGSGVYFGAWTKPAVAFVLDHRTLLAHRPVWLFSSGPVGPKDLGLAKEIAGFQVAITPREHHTFAGALDFSKLSFGERMMVRAVKAPEGDYRDWGEIDAWARGIAEELALASHLAGAV